MTPSVGKMLKTLFVGKKHKVIGIDEGFTVCMCVCVCVCVFYPSPLNLQMEF